MAPLNRRSLLKKTGLFAAGATFFPTFFTEAAASPTRCDGTPIPGHFIPDHAAYETTPPDMVARLNANENPFGPSEKAKKAIMDSLQESFRYSFQKGREMTMKVAAEEGVARDQVLMSAGSSPLLQAGALVYGKGTILSATPTYEDLLSQAESLGTKVIRVPLTPDYKYDLDAMEKLVDDKTSLVYICNPNNPTATVLETAKLRGFCERVSKKTTVFVDEAYIDYLDDPKGSSMMECVRKGQNVIVARTFSKLYGFAGLRVGYAVSSVANIQKLDAYSSGGSAISGPVWGAALAAYNDQEFLGTALQKTNASKQFLYDALKKEGYEYIPSTANFVMFPLKMEAKRFNTEMTKRGVGIRTWRFIEKDWCRVSVGTMEEMQAFARAFSELS